MRVRTKVKAGGWVCGHNQTMASDPGSLWIKTALVRLSVSVAATIGFLALSGSAFAADVYMGEYVQSDGRIVVYIEYWASLSEANEVRISIDSPTSVTIRDGGAPITAWWGWFGSYGCDTPEISDPGGGFPATCTHPYKIDRVSVYLRDGDDSLSIDPSTSSLPVFVYGGAGNDEIDLRNGSPGDWANCGDGFDWAFRDLGDSQYICETESIGGVLTSAPAVASWGLGRLDVFVRGTDNGLWYRSYEGGWSGWKPLGGVLTSAPAAVAWGVGRLDVFVRGTDNGLWHQCYSYPVGWSGWEPLGGELTSNPAVASWGSGRLDVFWRGTDGTLRHKSYDGGWSSEESLGGYLISSPAVVSWGLGRIDVFWAGLGSTLRHKSYEGSWSPEEYLGEGQLGSSPAVASRGAGSLDVFVLGTDGALYRKSYDGSWSEYWVPLGGRGHLASDPTAVSWGSGRLDVFMRGTDTTLWHLWP